MLLGVIAEDANDVEVLTILTSKLIPSHRFKIKRFAGGGCGKLRNKCTAWAKNLEARGCELIVVLHDLDDNDEDAIRKSLVASLKGLTVRAHLILLPKHELEAWLLTDRKALKSVFKLRKEPDVPNNPETIKDPKSRLRDIVWKCGQKKYIYTIHNKLISERISIDRITCKSFKPYPEFLKEHFP